METRYSTRPSETAVRRYREGLERFLAAQKVAVTIQLWDRPLVLGELNSGTFVPTDYFWVRATTIESPEVKALIVKPYSRGIDESMSDQDVWVDAWSIQNQLYERLGRKPSEPGPQSSDAYWRLWDHVPPPR